MSSTPRWLRTLEKNLQWLAIPNIAVLLVTLQALGFLMVLSDPVWVTRLALFPQAVLEGEFWRLVTFLAIPTTTSPLWMFFALWFTYFIVNAIENEWGEFKTTLYTLTSILITIAFSLGLGFPVVEASNFQSSLFLAAAALYPEMEIRLFFAIPVKMKWLGWFTLGFIALRFLQSEWLGRFYLLAIYSNYLLFFGPAIADRARQYARRKNFQRKMGR